MTVFFIKIQFVINKDGVVAHVNSQLLNYSCFEHVPCFEHLSSLSLIKL